MTIESLNTDAQLTLAGKAAVIFGADSIGSGIAQRFAREGAAVAIIDSDPVRAQSVVRLLNSPTGFWVVDLQQPASIKAAIDAAAESLGGLHILVNNVLPTPYIASLEDQDAAAFTASLAAVTATHAAMQAALPCLRAADGGRIINVGHRYGESANHAIGAYNAAAWALVGLTRTAAVDWGQYQIATNLLLPLADTPEYRSYHARRTKLLDLMVGQLPLGRMGDPVEDIGGAATFLASDAANFVNGEIIRGDGGQHIAGPVLNVGKFK